VCATPLSAPGQTRPATTQPAATRPAGVIPNYLAGKPVVEVRILGKTKPLGSITTSEITHQIRTREGAAFDPDTVEDDYRRIFGLRRFSNVEARVEPTDTGVIVIYEVTEQTQIKEIRFKGNDSIDTKTLQEAVNLKPGEAIDSFRLGLARDTIRQLYVDKRFPQAHVTVDENELSQNGVVVFNVVEGPRVKVRKVRILGNKSFGNSRIKDQIKTKSWFPFFVSGRFEQEQLDQDVASIRQFYESKGFFDVRVGRRVVVSPTQTEVMVDFVIEEGPRYVVDRVTFKGNATVAEAELRKDLKLVEGQFYDQDVIKRDTRQIVRAYSPYGFIYVPPSPADPTPDPDYMQIREQRFFMKEPGKVELVYDIHEGKPFRLGRVIVKGNAKTQDKVVMRELRTTPGELYNSNAVLRANDRIRATNLFQNVSLTPIGDDPESRDLLIEVVESATARFLIGAGVTSNSGLIGNITYEQRNFDISNWPASGSELFSSRAFTGAGQTFRVQLEPGTEWTRARVDFIEPWLFDQPYSFGVSGYLSQRWRRDWAEGRAGGRIQLGKRFSDIWSGRVSFKAEDVSISDIDDPEYRAREVVEAEGHHTLESLGLDIRRDTTDSPILPSQGTITTFAVEHYGALFSEYEFDRFTLGFNYYTTIYEDLLDRKTILAVRTDFGYITGDAPFFERFYGGGIGSVRGFRYRGISPRAGIDDDPIGGDFMATGSLELNFPVAGDVLRGVLFTDAGTVSEDFDFGTIRTSAGFGIRLSLPFFGQLPIALDFGFPITKDDKDETRLFSFSLGTVQ